MVHSLQNLDKRSGEQRCPIVPSGEIPEETAAWIEESVRERMATAASRGHLPARVIGHVENYLAAGARALTDGGDRHDLRWSYFRVDIGVYDAATYLVELLPTLLEAPVRSWWWLRKWDDRGHHVRLRIATSVGQGGEVFPAQELLGSARGHGTTRLPYEPELALFGGSTGLVLAHEFNHLDSDFVVRWLASGIPGQQRSSYLAEGLSLLLVDTLLSATGIDSFEKWDVWEKIRNQRGAISTAGSDIAEVRRRLRKIIDAANEVVDLHDPPQAELLRRHLPRVEALGHRLSDAARDGALERGLRQILAPLVLFHWNRAGFPYPTQARLAAALAAELDPF